MIKYGCEWLRACPEGMASPNVVVIQQVEKEGTQYIVSLKQILFILMRAVFSIVQQALVSHQAPVALHSIRTIMHNRDWRGRFPGRFSFCALKTSQKVSVQLQLRHREK